MRGYGDPAGQEITAFTSDTTTVFPWVLGYGDPDADTVYAAASHSDSFSLVGPHGWNYGDPAQLDNSSVLIASSKQVPDEGGVIVELLGDWPEIGPWRIRLQQVHTGLYFPGPSTYANSPSPGSGIDVETNKVEVEELGALVTKPGSVLRFVLPPLPTGMFSVSINTVVPLPTSEIVTEDLLEVIHRSRPLEVYTHRRRYPSPYSVGVRELTAESLLALAVEADGDESDP